jgi:dihydroorotate dehydrogenase electron transfer subunit
VADRAARHKWPAWISMDTKMGCGVGACLTCVLKVKDDSRDGWHWERSCREGPVFDSRKVLWEGIE